MELAEHHGAAIPSAAEYYRQDAGVRLLLADRTRGRLSTAVPLTDVDRAILRYKHEPGPAQYDTALPRSHIGQGFRFSRGHAKTEIELVQHVAKQLPGPADSVLPGPTHRHQLEIDQRADLIAQRLSG